ncbi:hypothetical protein MKEN_01353500 [Mycena kentingensis (nom. inval.)]|nr:hypothetical protein MKEN_01353500 [Mycena kentingensis (nom. inval.)]
MSVADQAGIEEAKVNCGNNATNLVVSCYPTKQTIVVQDQFTSFLWNSNNTQFTAGPGIVDIYLFHADTQQQVLHFPEVPNLRELEHYGVLTVVVSEAWFGERARKWDGANISYPFFWIMTPTNVALADGLAVAQATFTAIQTTRSAVSDLATSTSGSTTAPASPSLVGTGVSASGRKAPRPTPRIIAGAVVGSILAAASATLVIFLLLRARRRRHSKEAIHVFLDTTPGISPRPSKAALDAQMDAVQRRLNTLRVADNGEENSELHAQIAVLTAEVERLRALGAEPPPYEE